MLKSRQQIIRQSQRVIMRSFRRRANPTSGIPFTRRGPYANVNLCRTLELRASVMTAELLFVSSLDLRALARAGTSAPGQESAKETQSSNAYSSFDNDLVGLGIFRM